MVCWAPIRLALSVDFTPVPDHVYYEDSVFRDWFVDHTVITHPQFEQTGHATS